MIVTLFSSDKISGESSYFRIKLDMPPHSKYNRVRCVNAFFTKGATAPSNITVTLGGLGITNSYTTTSDSGSVIHPYIAMFTTDADTSGDWYHSNLPHPTLKIPPFTSAFAEVTLYTFVADDMHVVDKDLGVTSTQIMLEFTYEEE